MDIKELLEINTRDVPYFYEDGVCTASYVPVEGGKIRVFHHKPKNPITKRPILFIPGFGNSLWAWKEFSLPFVNRGEFYFLESREKKSSIFKNRFKTNITPEQVSEDIQDVIQYLGLENTDFVLFGTSYCGAAILKGLIEKQIKARTIVLFDPVAKLYYHRKMIGLLRFVPSFIINILRYLLGAIAIRGEKNEKQRERMKYVRDEAVPWKWRKASIGIFNFNILDELPKIDQELFIFHGPRDKHHPTEVYEEIASLIPKGRYFSVPVSEDSRELFCAVVGYEFSKIHENEGLPTLFETYEKRF